jgi:ABC-type transport system substrate-binding protein
LLLNLACGLGVPSSGEDATPTSVVQGGPPAENKDNSEIITESTEEATAEAMIENEEATKPDNQNGGTTEEPQQPESFELADEQSFILPGGEPPTLDPHLSGDATSAEYVVEIFSGLMTYDQDLNLIPDVAESYEVSEDGLVYTFNIREDAKFQDGKPLRADDFKWSFERVCDPATGSHTADTYMGDIVGCRDKLEGKADEVEGVVVVDDLTLELTIDEPKGFFLPKMTYPTAYVLDKDNVESGGSDWYKEANGSGPFRLDEFSLDGGSGIISLENNENYYREPRPTLKRIIYLVNAPINPMTGYEKNLEPITDRTFDAIEIGTANLGKVTDPNNPLSKEFVSTNALSVFYMGFNVNKPPFDDVKIRQAFNLALDKRRIVKLAFQGTVPVANGIVPPNMPGYENPDLSDYEFDPERALDLIADSSYGDVSELPEITLHVSGVG